MWTKGAKPYSDKAAVASYFTAVATVTTTAMMAIEKQAAIIPYSMAVVPRLSLINLFNRMRTSCPFLPQPPTGSNT
jgi:hypothetical protein